MRVIGPDVSFYQDNNETPLGIDFDKMAGQTSFVIIRAGQNTWMDTDFRINWQNAKEAGLARGSYWFYDSRADPKRQAEMWIRSLGSDLGELPLCADFEENYHGVYAGWDNFYIFLERLKALASGKEIVIYTGFYYWFDNVVNQTTSKQLEYFHQYPLWIARYGVDIPLVPKPWSHDEWLFWQYTENGPGELFGVESHRIDLNFFNGDEDAFRKRFKLDGQTEPPKAGIKFSVMYGDTLVKYKEQK